MKRRTFIQNTAATAGMAAAFPAAAGISSPADQKSKMIYELRKYQLKSGGAKTQLRKYLLEAVAPMLNEQGGKVGIFGEYSLEEPPMLYVLLCFPDMNQYFTMKNKMDTDPGFQAKAKAYNELPFDKPLFDRYETLLLEAFDAIPQVRQPDAGRGLFELRIYESYNEDASRRKILMFNKEELPLFDKVELNSVFFGKNLAGSHLPAMTYMLWFRDMKHRDEAWGRFIPHPEWIAMRDKPEYANTVSTIHRVFLVPEEGSQL